MAETTQQSSTPTTQDDVDSTHAAHASSAARSQSRRGNEGKHVHHGKTAAAWVGSMLALVGFVLGGFALVFGNWPLFWVAAGLCVVAVIAAKVLQVLGHGAG